MAFDMLTLVNLVLCVVIVGLGYWNYRQTKRKVNIYVAVAFGLFGLSHLSSLLGFGESLNTLLIVVRTLGYLSVIYALYDQAEEKS